MNMRTSILFSVFLLLALNAFGHAGEVHTYMGNVTAVHDDGSFVLKKPDVGTMPVKVSRTTTYLHADGSAATRAELTAGKRVVVTIAKDGRTATTIKLAAAKPSQRK